MDLLFLIVAPACIFAIGVALCVAARQEVEERCERDPEQNPTLWAGWDWED